MTAPVSEFYDRHPELYAAIADDRDFAEQAEVLQGYAPADVGSVLELFAGPAWHAAAFAAMGRKLMAIDCSPAMRAVAVARHPVLDRAYVCADVLEVADHAEGHSFDLALALRYSLGYVAPDRLPALFQAVASVLTPRGTFILECHRPDLLRDGLGTLAIKERRTRLPDGSTVACRWPAAPLAWDADGRAAEMLVQLDFDGPRPKSLEFTSREWIHETSDLCQIAITGGFAQAKIVNECRAGFDHSVLIVASRQLP